MTWRKIPPETSLIVRWLRGPASGRVLWITVISVSVAAYMVAAFASRMLLGANISPDFIEGYHPGALGIQKGLGYADAEGKLMTWWPPGYSVFISPWVVEDPGQSVAALAHVSGVLAVIWVLLLAWLGHRVVSGVSLVFLLPLCVFWPPLLALGNPTGSEMLFTVLCTGGVCLLVMLSETSWQSPGRMIVLAGLAGCMFGLATLTRILGFVAAGAAILAILLGFHHWRFRLRLGVSLCATLSFFLTLLPWLLTYHEMTGRIGFTDMHQSEAGFIITHHPQALTRVFHAWFNTSSGRLEDVLFVLNVPWSLLFLAASARTLWRWRSVPPAVILFHGMLGSAWVATAATWMLFRYLAPMFPFAVLAVGWHAVDLTTQLDRGSPGPRIQSRAEPLVLVE